MRHLEDMTPQHTPRVARNLDTIVQQGGYVRRSLGRVDAIRLRQRCMGSRGSLMG